MTQVNLATVIKKTPLLGTDKFAVWPASVTDSADLKHTTLTDLTSSISTALNSTFVNESLVTQAGDLLVGSGSPVEVAAVSVGTSGYVLTSKPSEAAKVSWEYVYSTPTLYNPQTATHDITVSDNGKIIEMRNTTAASVEIPPNSVEALPTGSQVTILRAGTGAVSIVPKSGVTLNSALNHRKIAEQWGAVTLIKRDTNSWVLIGDIAE
jgi:hypothetical protein